MSQSNKGKIKDIPLLLSVGKSGSNWIRYCVEYLTGFRTQGARSRLVDVQKNNSRQVHALMRSHKPVMPKIGRVIYGGKNTNPSGLILLYRNYKNIMFRGWNGVIDKKSIHNRVSNTSTYYRSLFEFYENSEINGEKIFLTYEAYTFEDIKKILKMIDFPIISDIDDFEKNLEDHKKKSFELLGKHSGNLVYSGKIYGNREVVYYEDVPKEVLLEIDSIFEKVCGRYYSIYLKQYKEKNIQ